MAAFAVITEATKEDYTISPSDTFMIVDKDAMGPSSSGLYKLAQSCFIPSGAKVKCSIAASPDYDTSVAIDGFVIFDTTRRYRINFPKPLKPTPQEKKKALAEFKNFKFDKQQ